MATAAVTSITSMGRELSTLFLMCSSQSRSESPNQKARK